MGRKITAAALSAALVLSGSGPIYAQEIRAISAGNINRAGAAGTGGAAGAALAIPQVFSPLSPSALNAALTPALSGAAAPSLTPPLGALGGHARALPVLASPSMLPAAAPVPAAARPARAGRLAALKALVGASAASAPERLPAIGAAKTPGESVDATALPAEAVDGDAKDFADAAFRRLGAEGGAAVSGEAAEPVAPADVAAPSGWTSRLGISLTAPFTGGPLAAANSGLRAPSLVSSSLSAPASSSFAGIGQFLGQAGYWLGNTLAFLFPIPEVYKAIKDGKVGVPTWRAGILVTASLALGLVNATVAGMPLWGIQNIFAAAVMLLAWPAARWGKRAAGEAGLSGKKSAAATAVTVAVALAAAAAVYFAAAAVVPAALAAAFGAATVANITLGIMAVTGGAFFLLFLPDIISIVRGRAPNGFTPGFSLMFLLASLSFFLWTGNLAWLAAPGSPQRVQFGLYAALNAAYAVVSGVSWWIGRRKAKTPLGAPPSGAPPSSTPPSSALPLVAPSAQTPAAPAAAPVVAAVTNPAELSTDLVQTKSVDDSLVKETPVAREPAAPASTEPALPRSWKRFPAEAREATTAAMLEAKAEAQARARALAPDARLVSVAINLEDPRSHWSFTFRSDKRREELTVWTKRVGVRKLGPRPMKAPTLWEPRLAAMPSLDRAYAALKKANPRFRPVRVEVDPAWTGAASYRFLDALGRAAFVGADGKPRFEAPPLALKADAKPPKSFAALPEDARGADGKSLRALKAGAQARARVLAPDARLVRVAINLEDPRSHWIFIFRSDARREELTVWTKRIAVKRLLPGARRIPTLHDSRLEKSSSVAAAYAALKAAKPGLRPLRLELIPTWKGDAAWSFLDARGRGTAVASVVAQAAPAPKPGIPDERGPPTDVPSAPTAPVVPAIPEKIAPAAPAPETAKPAAPKAEPPKPAASYGPKKPIKHIHESFLGFRTVKGVRHDPKLKPLLKIESIEQVVDHISRQFNIPRARVLELGVKYRLNEFSPLGSWIGVYDRLQAANRDQFKRLDSKKYNTWQEDEEPVKRGFGAFLNGLRPSSIARRVARHFTREKATFRMLANKTYPEGARGTLVRASQFWIHLIGAAVRFPYHLFDMFIFGYFRQAISFEFRHSGEDFMALSGREKFAEQWLESAMRHDAFEGAGALSGLRAARWYRTLNRWFLVPFAKPLTTFIVRRLTLAVMSAIAMGVLGAFAPVLPLSFALTSIPVFGPAVVAVLGGLPVAVAAVPFVGEFLAPVVGQATAALAKDLILGPLMNTLILSTLLTFPAAARERIARLRDEAPLASLPIGGMVKAVLGAAISWEFWRSNWKSFFGLVTVGAEIEGIMTYAGGIDAAIDPVFDAAFGVKPGIFHAIGAAVERPGEWIDEHGVKHENLIPFGGAITWGSVLLHKLQGLAGVNISDAVMRSTLMAKGMIFGESAKDLPMAMQTAQGLISASSERTKGQGGLPFDPDLWKKPWSEAVARIKELAGTAGHLDAEIGAVKEHRAKLLAELGETSAQLERLQTLSRPVTPEERAEYERLIAELSAKSDEVGVREKLAERRDLLQPPSDAAALARLEALKKEFTGMTPPPPPDRNGYWEDLAVQEASMKALSQRLGDYAEGRGAAARGGVTPTLSADTRDKITAIVAEIEMMRAEAKVELSQRDAASQLLASSNRVRNAALRERRDGKDMMRLHTDMAKLASVMDLALSLNEINAAQAAITQMLELLDVKRGRIGESRTGNEQNLSGADRNAAMDAQWRAEVDADIAADDSTLADLAESEVKTSLVVSRLEAAQADLRGFIDSVNARDRGASADAAAEYQRRIDLLPQIKAWRENGGNPNDPDAFSLKKMNEDLAELNDNIQKAQDGLASLPNAPDEFAGVLIAKIPGPGVSLSNPTPAQMRQVIADRKAHWQEKRADFADSLAKVERMLGQGGGAAIDEFGDPHPESLPQRRAQAQTDISSAETAARQYLSQLDALAANINRASGASIPMLSGLGLEQLQDAIEPYGDSLKAVNFRDDETLETHKAMMDLITSAKLVPYAAREIIRWSEADETVKTIDDAVQNILPEARTSLQGIVGMIDAILGDAALDEAWIANPPPNGPAGRPGRLALIDRKTALLRDVILPALLGARSMLTDTLIPFQQKSIADIAATDTGYFKLYDAKKKLIVAVDKLYNQTLPWTFATFGAEDGDQAEATRKIGEWRHKLQKNLDGYDDAEGRHKGIHEFQIEIANRKDPNFTGTETLYGELQPFSLPRKIAQYTAERAQRANEINVQDTQINEIIGKIETVSKGRFVMSNYRLPVGVTPDAAGAARVQAAVDARVIQDLVDRLKVVADEAQTGEVGLDLAGGGDGTVQSGTQDRIRLTDNQTIALLALDAAKRLVPTSLDQPGTAPAAYAIARMLYADSVIEAATDGLNVQVPAAERFVDRAATVLGDEIAKIAMDEAYAASNGASETAEQVFARKIASYSTINALLREGLDFFRLKQGWNRDKLGTLDSVQDYYDALHDIYDGGQEANDSEIEALDKMEEALRTTLTDLEEKRVKISAWLNQLNPKEKSALNNVSEDISRIMERTRAVLEANIDWHGLQEQVGRSREILKAQFTRIDDRQAELAAILAQPEVQGQLPPDLLRRVEALRIGRSGWANDGTKADPASLVIRKSEYGAFVDILLGMVTQGAQSSAAEMAAIKSDLLKNPQGLASLIPNSKVLEFGDTADGFYLVYQSKFSVPHGLDTSSLVTLGNIGRVFGSNVSISGYQIASPPSEDGENAPYGVKAIGVQVETLQHKNFVNYLNVDLRRFAFDIPADNSIATGAGESRLFIFNDIAYMSDGKDLYIGLAGFADGAVNDTANKPYYYGGNLKSSVRLTKVLTFDAEQRALWATDPRKFVQDVNLDFTGFDPDLNREFRIMAEGEKKEYFRTQVGPKLDLNRLMNPDGGGDTFSLDLYWAKTSGTDDINQQAAGVSILKGFSLKNDQGKTWMRIDNRLTGELGQKQNEIGDRLSVSFPDQGLVVSGEGKIIGGAEAYFGEITKKMGDHGHIAVGYGSQYVGMKDRFSISMNTTFTLAELWQKVSDNSAENLRGGETLRAYNRGLGDFFSSDEAKSSRTAMDLQKVFEQDVARKLVTQHIGNLTREIQELRKAGAVMENTRVRGMVGFVSGSVSNDLAERAVGGGVTAGTYSEMSLSRTQKQLIESKAQILYREGLRLQDRMLSLTKDWQASVVEIAEAQWALKIADFAVRNAPSEASRREAAVRLNAAESRLHQSVLRYNALTGRDLQAPTPFQDLNSEDLRRMLGNIRRLITSPDRLSSILGSLNEESLKKSVGDNPFNVADWIPWVDRLTIGFGVQYQDMMANQALTIGGSVRLPIYDPAGKSADKAYALESQAAREEMKQAYAERLLASQAAVEQAGVWEATARAVEPGAPAAAQALSDAIRAYRNGLISAADLRSAFASWDWHMSTSINALSQAALLKAQAGVDAPFERPTRNDGKPLSLASIDDAFAAASANSHSLGEIAKRQEAAEEMARSADHRIQKAWLDINVGIGLTASGVGWIPSLGVTGVPVTPVLGFELKPEEMRELQVQQHGQQAEYYKALKGRVEIGLAVQFYTNMVAMRAAESQMAILRNTTARSAVVYEAARLEFVKARETINFLLGRPADAPVTVAIDERQALVALSRILAAKDPVGTQRRILDARVATAKAVEEMVDKDLKVEMLQLEPVSLVVRALGRLMGALSDSPVYNPELAAGARIQTLTAERERDAYDARREGEVAKLALQLNAARAALLAVVGGGREALLEKSRLAAAIFTLQADILARGVDPDSALVAKNGDLPKSWAELTRRLSASEQSLTTVAPEDKLDLTAPENRKYRSAAFVRYYYAQQTLGQDSIGKGFLEGWIELRLSDPGTPPEVLLALAKLRTDKADRLYRDALVGAAARADILAAQFEGDARLLRFLDREIANRDASQPPADLDRVRRALVDRLKVQGQGLIARLGLAPETSLDALLRLAPDDASPAGDLRGLAARLIEDIRARQIDSIRRTLFDGGTPASWGDEDGIMNQIKAHTIAERMSYKGFTPVATFGNFRGTTIGGGFIEAPDPRAIEAGLEKVMGEVLRKEMQSSGKLQELTLRLHSLMVRVEDGAKGLEARRKLIEAAENDLRVRAETSGTRSADYGAAQDALVSAWNGFARAMTTTKADFITLVTELEALGEGSAGALRAFSAPDRPEAPVASDPKNQLLDYWSGRFSDPSFEAGQAALFARMGTAVPQAVRARIGERAASYRTALRDADGIATNDYTPAEKFVRLTKIDVEGKRLELRAGLEAALRGIGLLDPASNPVAADFLSFMRADLAAASKAFALDRGEKVRIDRALSETYWRAHKPSDAEAATFARLDALNASLEDARDRLMTSYLADSGEDATRFVLKDLELDAYLKAQSAFDAEMARALEGKPSPAVVRALEGLYDLREVLDRSIARAKHGRGMGALDALIMLEQARLRAARWTRQTPARIDPIAAALSRLKGTRERWTSGKVGPELQPLYAVTRLDGEGRRTWTVDQWLTADEFNAKVLEGADPKRAGEAGAVIARKDPKTGKIGWFIDRPGAGTVKYEVVGGADAAEAARESADSKFRDNRGLASLQARMKDSDFVAPGEPGKEAAGWDFAAVFGPGGLHEKGRVFFFEARADGKPSKALHPLEALSRPPEEVVMKVYTGGEPLSRDRFPTLKSLEASEEAGAFKTLTVSPAGAAALIANARRLEAYSLRRGWIEVKLNSFGFARDEKGQVSQLYRTKDDFEAQWKAFDHASRDRDSAIGGLKSAKAEEAARKGEADAAKAAADRQGLLYQTAQARLREALRAAMIEGGLDPSALTFKTELDRRVAEPQAGKLPKAKTAERQREILSAHAAYASENKAMAAAAKTFTEASSKLKLAAVRAVNADKALRDAQLTLVRSGAWTLHRTADLTLGLDSNDRLVNVAAPRARGAKDLDEAVAGGGPSVRKVSSLLGAAVDEDGRLRRAYATQKQVDDALKAWRLISYRAGGDVIGGDADEALTKVRFSHYEETIDGKALPVLLGQTYLIQRLGGAEAALGKAERWSYLPFNWGNILLEIPRGIAGIPAEFAGRDQRRHHYLGRAYMYKTEGGATEHHGFFRSVLGVVDVLNLLPDPADRFFDPSQFPDKVHIDSALRPGEGLWNKELKADIRGKEMDIHLGRQSLRRGSAHAAEDLEAARVRTLSRFHGGVEQLTLETRRGRAGWYQESTRTAELGAGAISRRLSDGAISSDPLSGGSPDEDRDGDVVTSATPGHLFVDQVERRVRVRPGAESYGRQAAALDGYADRTAERGRTIEADRVALERTLERAKAEVAGTLADRDRARADQERLRSDWHRLAQRIGVQLELEGRIAALQAGLAALKSRIAFWDRYLDLLHEARRNPSNPTDPTDPSRPRPPFGPNPMFWVWLMALSFLGAIASALWHRRRRPSSPPNPA